MDANVTTTAQSEPDHDNSSLQNPSTNPAEAGTTDETRDEDHETSSIEALNWSEVEEEELAAAQQATLVSLAPEKKLSSATKVSIKDDKDDDNVTNNESSTNEEGSVLSTMLLQSINSSVSDEDPQVRKLTVIENWASEVTNAVKRGEIVMTEDFPDENGVPGNEDESDSNGKGLRKRKGKVSPEMVSSMMSSASNGESTIDPLSNAPVLDDGPIWNKGPRTYTFQENRRFNQKLTFCLLIAVVLAIGLGLGNLVAHQECEAEYKASQQSQIKHTDKISLHTVPTTTTTPAPIIPDKSTDSSMMGSTLPKSQPVSYAESVDSSNIKSEEVVSSEIENPAKRHMPTIHNSNNEDHRKKRDDPVIDPKYKVHAETVSSVVHTLDRLSREIDQFENTTRKLQGVLMIPENEKSDTETPSKSQLYNEEIYQDVDSGSVNNIDEVTLEDEEDETAIIEDLIDAIEQTPDYLEQKKAEKRLEELQKSNRRYSKVFNLEDPDNPENKPSNPGRDKDIKMILKSIQQFKDFQRRFVKTERKKLREEGKYHKLNWRLPEEYSEDEKNALRVRYRSNWQEFLKLIKNKVPDPIEVLFGTEEEEEERTYGDVFHYPFPDPDDDLTSEEYETQFRNNLEELGIFGEKSQPAKADSKDGLEELIDSDPSIPSNLGIESPSAGVKSPGPVDDLIIAERKQHATMNDIKPEAGITEQDQVQSEPGKSTTSNDDSIRADTLKRNENREVNSRNREVYKDNNSKRDINGNKLQAQSEKFAAKNKQRDQNQKEQKSKQKKQKNKNGNGSSSASNKNDPNSGNIKISSKERKLKNKDSNKVFENIKGKNVDKRRGASQETQRKFNEDIKYSDKNSASSKKSPDGSIKNLNGKDEAGRGDLKQKAKQILNKFDDIKTSSERNYKNQPYRDRRQQRQENHYQKMKYKQDFSSSKETPNQEDKKRSKDKEAQYQKSNTGEYIKKYEKNVNQNFENHQNGKKSKSWQSKEKVDRRSQGKSR